MSYLTYSILSKSNRKIKAYQFMQNTNDKMELNNPNYKLEFSSPPNINLIEQ